MGKKAIAPLDPPQASYLGRAGIVLLLAAVAGLGGLLAYSIMQRPALIVTPVADRVAESAVTPAEEAATSADAPSAEPRPMPTPIDYKGKFQIINGHDHLYREQDLGKYLEAAAQTDITSTVFVASSEFTFKGDSGAPDQLNDWSTREILRCAALHPGKIITFASFHPNEPAKLELLQEYVGLGVQGLKLYTGHGSFYDRPLAAPEMLPIYGYCQEIGLPICWHVNFEKYINEFEMIMAQFPRLKVIVPHFGVTFYRPGGVAWNRLAALLDQYPGLYVDCSFGTRDIQVAGLSRVDQYRDIFRDFFERYQDRIVWGTDMVVTGNKEKTPEWIRSVIQACRDMVEQEEYLFWMAKKGGKYAGTYAPNAEGRLRGLALPPAILEKIYRTNLERILARPAIAGE
jgi:predicted TIM-barrel fold metal-dependent hydrolase